MKKTGKRQCKIGMMSRLGLHQNSGYSIVHSESDTTSSVLRQHRSLRKNRRKSYPSASKPYRHTEQQSLQTYITPIYAAFHKFRNINSEKQSLKAYSSVYGSLKNCNLTRRENKFDKFRIKTDARQSLSQHGYMSLSLTVLIIARSLSKNFQEMTSMFAQKTGKVSGFVSENGHSVHFRTLCFFVNTLIFN